MAKREYRNGEDLTVLWDSDLCIHCHKCADALPDVFRPAERPWVNLAAGRTEDIKRVVNECPSGAISLGNP